MLLHHPDRPELGSTWRSSLLDRDFSQLENMNVKTLQMDPWDGSRWEFLSDLRVKGEDANSALKRTTSNSDYATTWHISGHVAKVQSIPRGGIEEC